MRPFVALLWASGTVPGPLYARPLREHVLPTGMMHLVFRLDDRATVLVCPSLGDTCTRPLAEAVVGGARSRFHLRELTGPGCSVGAMLRPGAARCLFGVGAHELAECHTPLADLWPGVAGAIHARLLETPDAEGRLAVLEAALMTRLGGSDASAQPAVAAGLGALESLQPVAAAVAAAGLSHRVFIERFRRATGLNPGTYLRLRRFQYALHLMARHRTMTLAALAAEAGYCDQAHFNREFATLTGVTPGDYRARAPLHPNHLPLSEPPAGRGHDG